MCRFKTCLLLKERCENEKLPRGSIWRLWVQKRREGATGFVGQCLYGELPHLHVKYCILNIWIITENEFGNGVANVYSTCYLITWYETCYYAILLQRSNILLKRYKSLVVSKTYCMTCYLITWWMKQIVLTLYINLLASKYLTGN